MGRRRIYQHLRRTVRRRLRDREPPITFGADFKLTTTDKSLAVGTRNDLDMGIVAGALPSGELHARGLSPDEFVMIAPPNSLLAKARVVKPNQLEVETWLLREEGSDTRRQLAVWWHRHRLAPARTMTFDNPDAVKRAVMAGLGIAMVSRLTVDDDLASGRVASVNIKTGLPAREFFVVDHLHKHHGAACRAMLQLLERTFEMHRAPPRHRGAE